VRPTSTSWLETLAEENRPSRAAMSQGDSRVTPLIIDTDPGIDDAFAIALACASPDVELLAITTVFGNVGLADTTRNALRILALCGREDVPVAAGANRPLVHPKARAARHVHGHDGLSGHSDRLPRRARGIEQTDAVALLAQVLHRATEPVTIAAIGPLTNIALLLAAHPSVVAKIDRLVIMGGGLAGGNVTPAAEFNIWSDPEAARRVLAEDRPPTVLVPLEVTVRCAVDANWLGTLESAHAIGQALTALTSDYRNYYRSSLGHDGIVLHDAVAVAEAISPGLLHTETLQVDVDCGFGPGRGAVIADRRSGQPGAPSSADTESSVDVAVTTDFDAIRGFVLDRLAG
jgi:pyrimidine-specific ribonucleoside hydrolase